MVNLIHPHPPHMPTANYSHMVMERELMVDGDEGGDDGGEDGLRIPPPEKKSWIDLSSETMIVMVAEVYFAKAPLLLGQVFFLIYEGVSRRPEARRCPRPKLGGPTRPQYQVAWGYPFWPSGTPSCPSFVQRASFP